MKTLWLVPFLLLAAVSVQAAEAKPAAKPQPDSKSNLVCFSEKVTGSNLRKRLCMTEQERELRRQQDQEALGDLKGSSAGRKSSSTEANVRR